MKKSDNGESKQYKLKIHTQKRESKIYNIKSKGNLQRNLILLP